MQNSFGAIHPENHSSVEKKPFNRREVVNEIHDVTKAELLPHFATAGCILNPAIE